MVAVYLGDEGDGASVCDAIAMRNESDADNKKMKHRWLVPPAFVQRQYLRNQGFCFVVANDVGG